MIRKPSAIVVFRNKNSPKAGPISKRLNAFCARFQRMALNNVETQDRSRVQCIAIKEILSCVFKIIYLINSEFYLILNINIT